MDIEKPFDDRRWTARCVARLVELDPLLVPALAQPIADDMSARPRWRRMAPEDAAQAMFDFGAKR